MESTNKSGVQFVQRPVLNQALQAITLYAVSGSKKGAGHISELTNEALLVRLLVCKRGRVASVSPAANRSAANRVGCPMGNQSRVGKGRQELALHDTLVGGARSPTLRENRPDVEHGRRGKPRTVTSRQEVTNIRHRLRGLVVHSVIRLVNCVARVDGRSGSRHSGKTSLNGDAAFILFSCLRTGAEMSDCLCGL